MNGAALFSSIRKKSIPIIRRESIMGRSQYFLLFRRKTPICFRIAMVKFRV